MAESTLSHNLHVLYSDHHGWLFGWLRKKLGCSHQAADLAQDTFVRIIASRDALLGMQEPRAYLTTTAKRLMLDQARRQTIEQAYLEQLAQSMTQAAGYPSAEEILLAVEALNQIGAALECLPFKVQQAFLLHYLDDLGHAEVAAALGVSTRMVRKYLVQALVSCQLHLPR